MSCRQTCVLPVFVTGIDPWTVSVRVQSSLGARTTNETDRAANHKWWAPVRARPSERESLPRLRRGVDSDAHGAYRVTAAASRARTRFRECSRPTAEIDGLRTRQGGALDGQRPCFGLDRSPVGCKLDGPMWPVWRQLRLEQLARNAVDRRCRSRSCGQVERNTRRSANTGPSQV